MLQVSFMLFRLTQAPPIPSACLAKKQRESRKKKRPVLGEHRALFILTWVAAIVRFPGRQTTLQSVGGAAWGYPVMAAARV